MQRASSPRLNKSWKNFTRSFLPGRAMHCFLRSYKFFLLWSDVRLVKFNFNFRAFSCSTQILSKIAQGMLTATKRLLHFLFNFYPAKLPS